MKKQQVEVFLGKKVKVFFKDGDIITGELENGKVIEKDPQNKVFFFRLKECGLNFLSSHVFKIEEAER